MRRVPSKKRPRREGRAAHYNHPAFKRLLARLGANTVFSFGADTKSYDLGGGAILMCAPKSSGQSPVPTPRK